jgi:tetratricopeptide (TPR) repeat protein
VLGRSYDDRGYHNQALTAYEAAVTADPLNGNAQFQLGQAQFRKKDYARAKASLEAFVASPAAKTDSMAAATANKMLLEIAANP